MNFKKNFLKYRIINVHCNIYTYIYGFPGSSDGKESTCNAGEPSSIPGWGRFAGEGIGYPLHYSWASLVAQLVKNPPAVWETWVRSLGRRALLLHLSWFAWIFVIYRNLREIWASERPNRKQVWIFKRIFLKYKIIKCSLEYIYTPVTIYMYLDGSKCENSNTAL